MTIKMAWATQDNELPRDNLPAWKRTVGLDTEGNVWVPAAIAASEEKVIFWLDRDNERWAFRDDHLFVRASWARQRFPHAGAVLDPMVIGFLSFTETAEFATNEWQAPELMNRSNSLSI